MICETGRIIVSTFGSFGCYSKRVQGTYQECASFGSARVGRVSNTKSTEQQVAHTPVCGCESDAGDAMKVKSAVEGEIKVRAP